jgi:predicted O-methyltransferase YrrM
MKNRIELAEYFNTLNFKIIVEVGVFDGHYSEILCQKNPSAKIYAVDPWEIYGGYRDHKFKSSMERAYNSAKSKLAPHNCEIVKKFSVDAAKDFKDGSIDAVFIDGNHSYDYVKQDIELWAPKVGVGGIVSGHDYYVFKHSHNVGVIKAVDEFVAANGYKLELTDWDKKAEFTDDRQPCWWFKK